MAALLLTTDQDTDRSNQNVLRKAPIPKKTTGE